MDEAKRRDGSRVLILQNGDVGSSALSTILRDEGFEVSEDISTCTALARWHPGDADVAIVRIGPADLDSPVLWNGLANLAAAIPLIIYDQQNCSQAARRAVAIGAIAHIPQQDDPSELIVRVYRAIHAQTRKHATALEKSLAIRTRALSRIGTVLAKETQERMRADAALEACSSKYHNLHKSMADGYVAVDMGGRISEVNRAYQDMLGYSEAELRALNYQDLTPERWHRLEAAIVEQQILPRGYSDVYEKEYRREDGTIFPVELRTFLIKDSQGEPTAMWAIVRDISDRKRAEKAIQESERFLRATLDALASHIAILDEDGTILAVNEAWREFARANTANGTTTYEGDNYLAVCDKASGADAESIHAIAAELRKVLCGDRESFMIEYPCHSPDEQRWFVLRATRFAGPRPLCTVVAHADITDRTLARLALAKNEQRLKNAQAVGQIGDWEWHLSTGATSWSDEVFHIYGFQPNEIQPSFELAKALVHPDDREQWHNHMLQGLDSSNQFEIEYRAIQKKGDIIWLLNEVCVMRDTTGKVTHVVGTTQNITNFKSTEAALIASEERFRRAIADSPFPLLIHAEGGEVVLVNHAWTDISGYTHEEIPTVAAWTERAYGERKEAVQKKIDQLYQLQGPRKEGEFTIRTRRGDMRIWDFSSSPIGCLPDGRRLVLSMAMDVTARKQAEVSSARSAEELAAVYDNTPMMILLVDKRQRIRQANRMAQQFNAVDISTLDNRVCDAMRCVHAGGQSEQRDSDTDCVTCGLCSVMLDTLSNSNNHHREKHRLAVIRDEQVEDIVILVSSIGLKLDASPHILLMIEDITKHELLERQLRQREAELAQLDRLNAMGTMTATLAHELNQPLHAINNYVRGIRRRLQHRQEPPNLTEMSGVMDQVSKEVARAADIISNLRNFIGGREPCRSQVGIDQLLHHTFELLHPVAELQGVTLTLAVQPNLPPILADPVQLEQVVVNLVANAIDSMATTQPYRKTATIIAKQSSAGSVEIEVQDLGIGILSNIEDNLFKAFVSTKQNGLGVGLAISKSIVESHGGTIWTEHRDPCGTSVHFTIAINLEDEEAAPETAS